MFTSIQSTQIASRCHYTNRQITIIDETDLRTLVIITFTYNAITTILNI